MFDHIPMSLALIVGGILLMVIVVLAVTEGLERRRTKREAGRPDNGTG